MGWEVCYCLTQERNRVVIPLDWKFYAGYKIPGREKQFLVKIENEVRDFTPS